MNDRKLVFLESPFAAKSRERGLLHINYMQACIRHSIEQGEAPFSSHQMYTPALDDDDPWQRADGISCGYAWAQFARYMVVYADLGISAGMRMAMNRWQNKGKAVQIRRLGGTWAEQAEKEAQE